ncbi:MAG TPA: TrkA family potassium uptake protein [Vicinamibacteria bacterium]|nr:TrkA family potassium uptake protein [Vicinamibacteria bacterium]
MKAKKVLVIGVGRFGTALVETLWRGRAEVVAVDTNADAVEAIKDRTSHAFVGDGTDPRVLEGLASDVDIAVVTFGMAFESTVLAVATLGRLDVPYIVARVETARQAEIMEKIGAHRVVQLEAEMGGRIGRDILSPVESDLLDLADEYRIVPWVAHGPLVGRSLAEAHLRQRYALTVLGYRKAGENGRERSPLVVATPEYVIGDGDTLLLVGEQKQVDEFLAGDGRARQ